MSYNIYYITESHYSFETGGIDSKSIASSEDWAHIENLFFALVDKHQEVHQNQVDDCVIYRLKKITDPIEKPEVLRYRVFIRSCFCDDILGG